MCIGLVVTTDGFPLGYEAEGQAPLKARPALTGVVFAGNRNDVKTLDEIVEAMEAKYGRAGRIWPQVRFRRGAAGPDGPGSSTAGSRARQIWNSCASEAGDTSLARRR